MFSFFKKYCTLGFETDAKVIRPYVCLSCKRCMQHSVTAVISVGGNTDFTMVVIIIKSDTTGGETLHSSDNKTSVFITPDRPPRPKQLAHHMITTARLLSVGAIALSVNSTLERSVELVAYN